MQLAETAADRLPPVRLFASDQMTTVGSAPTLSFVPANWPRETFMQFLHARRDRAEIKDDATLARLAGFHPSLISNWDNGKSQPNMGSLNKLAPVLDLVPKTLWLAAGLVTIHELGEDTEPNLVVLPREFDDLTNLYLSADDEGKRIIREQLGVAARGLASLIAKPVIKAQPQRRRSA